MKNEMNYFIENKFDVMLVLTKKGVMFITERKMQRQTSFEPFIYVFIVSSN